MREYKIRAWDPMLEEMLYSEREDFDDMIGFRFKHFEADEPIIMQWAWAKDINGKDIYEGDIVQVGEGKWKCAVYLSNETKAFMLKDLNRKYQDSINFMAQYDKYKVVGNIYENPEILKEED